MFEPAACFPSLLKHGMTRVTLMDHRELGQTRTAAQIVRTADHEPRCIRPRWKKSRIQINCSVHPRARRPSPARRVGNR